MPEPPQTSNQLPTFVGKYRIVRMIARSNDIVYEAVDPNLGRHVALKELVLAPDLTGAARRERIERFQREAKAAGALKHPNIVTIYEVGQHLEHRFIAMEYLEGQTLRDRMNVGGPMPIKDVLHIAIQLSDALGYAHTQGVVHRDVKPDNIHLVHPNSTLKLTDFGIARVLTEPAITSAGQIFGTPSYMSPEQLTSRLVDHRTDIFSTAVVIYEMLLGKKPFRGDSVIAVTYQIMHSEIQIPHTIPSGIAAILNRGFAKDPDLRYQNMRTLAADLRTELFNLDMPQRKPASDLSEKTQLISSTRDDVPKLTPASAEAASTTSPATTSHTLETETSTSFPTLIRAMDADENLRQAVLRLGGTIAALAGLIVVTLWGIWQFSLRLQDNLRHSRALGSYEAAIDSATSGDLAGAISHYRDSMGIVNQSDILYDRCRRGISDCLTAQGAHSETTSDLTGAEESFEDAIKEDVSNAVPHYDLAILYLSRGDQVDALHEFVQAHAMEPFSIAGMEARRQALDGYLQLGDADRAKGNAALARQDWQQVIDLDSGSSEADQARERMSGA